MNHYAINVQQDIIVGGGSSAIGIAQMTADQYAAAYQHGAHNVAPLNLIIADKTGQYGPGYGHNVDHDIFYVNQPARWMSLFPYDRDHFVRYLERVKGAKPGSLRNFFATRQDYKGYLSHEAQILARDLRASNIPMSVVFQNRHITDLDKMQNGQIDLVDSQGLHTIADNVVVATGHQQSKFLHEHDGNPRYQSGIYNIQQAGSVLQGNSPVNRVLFIGTGQSMVDGIAILNHFDYHGQAVAVSRQLAKPWALHPDQHPDHVGYKLQYLHVDHLKQHMAGTAEFFMQLFHLEANRLASRNLGLGFLVSNIDYGWLYNATYNDTTLKGLADFYHYIVKMYSNPTTPDRAAMLARYEANGQLVYQSGRIQPEHVKEVKNGFAVSGLAKDPVHFDMIFNGASISHDPFDCELLAAMKAKGLLNMYQGRIINGMETHDPSIRITGCAVHPDKNGIETFSKKNKQISDDLIASNQAYQRKHVIG